MSLAAISLSALIAALVISCFSEINIGILAIVFAWIVGVYFGGMKVDQVIAGFPTALFLTLVALTLLFAQAQVNGTLDRFARRAVHLCRGNAGVIPMMFFVMTALLSSIGPGNVASTALMAPLGMAVAGRYNISPFLMTIMIANGASAGSLPPKSFSVSCDGTWGSAPSAATTSRHRVRLRRSRRERGSASGCRRCTDC